MKTFAGLFLALQGASAFPAVMEAVANSEKRSSGCTTSTLCNTKYTVTDADIDYNPDAPTAAQVASAGRNHCGNLTPVCLLICLNVFDSTLTLSVHSLRCW